MLSSLRGLEIYAKSSTVHTIQLDAAAGSDGSSFRLGFWWGCIQVMNSGNFVWESMQLGRSWSTVMTRGSNRIMTISFFRNAFYIISDQNRALFAWEI